MTSRKSTSRTRNNILLIQLYKHDKQHFHCCICETGFELDLPAGEYQGWPVISIIKSINKHLEKFHPGMTIEDLTEGLPDGKKRYPNRGFSI